MQRGTYLSIVPPGRADACISSGGTFYELDRPTNHYIHYTDQLID